MDENNQNNPTPLQPIQNPINPITPAQGQQVTSPTQQPQIPTSSPVQPVNQQLNTPEVGLNSIVSPSTKKNFIIIAILFPVILVTTLLSGGSITDVFGDNISERELRQAVYDEVNRGSIFSRYDFSFSSESSINCKGKLKNKNNATQTCTGVASSSSKIKGNIEFTVKVYSTAGEGLLPEVRISDVRNI